MCSISEYFKLCLSFSTEQFTPLHPMSEALKTHHLPVLTHPGSWLWALPAGDLLSTGAWAELVGHKLSERRTLCLRIPIGDQLLLLLQLLLQLTVASSDAK